MNNLDNYDLACNIIELQYMKLLRKRPKFANLSDYDFRKMVYPDEWNFITDKKMKLMALKEAIENNKLLIETEYISDYYKKM